MFFKKKAPVSGPVEYLIVGLGNPGRQYEVTRHNAGFLALDVIAKAAGISMKQIKFKSTCGKGEVCGHSVLLMKPSTFMNNSGIAVGEAARFYKVPPERIIVLSDEVLQDVGKVRIRRKGSDGGHNGLKSIIYHLNSDAFPRIKIGVGKKPHPDYDLADWVLGNLRGEDTKLLDETFERVNKAVQMMVTGDVDGAMSRYNG